MRLDELMARMEQLLDAQEAQQSDDPGEGNFRCENCVACYQCRFCVDCDSCEDCTYCEESVDCAKCTHCKRCVSCVECTYTEDSRDCEGSRYLTLCVGCKDSTHCLGCVGLSGAEFFVLNEQKTRKEYFAALRAVQDEMAARFESGWRPPPIGLVVETVDTVDAAEAADTGGPVAPAQPLDAPRSPAVDWGGPVAAEVTHTQDLDQLDPRHPGSAEASGWAWTDPPPREHTGVEELPPPPPYDTDAGIEPRELSSPWIDDGPLGEGPLDEPRRDSTWHGDEDRGRRRPDHDSDPDPDHDHDHVRRPFTPAKKSSAWLDPLAEGPGRGESAGPADEAGSDRPRRGGLARGARPARPPERVARDGTGSGSGSGSGSARRRGLEESSMVRPRKPVRGEGSGSGAGSGSGSGSGRGPGSGSARGSRRRGDGPESPSGGGLRRGRPPTRGGPPDER